MTRDRRDVNELIATTQDLLDHFETLLNDLTATIDKLEAETKRQQRGQTDGAT